MQALFGQLGIDWRLLLSQAVNFFLLLLVLRLFVYKPLLKLLHERKKKIEEGIAKAEEADKRLRDIDEIGKGKIRQAETEAVGILRKTEGDAKALEAMLIAEAKRKEAEELKSVEAILRVKEEESRRLIEREAAAFVKRAIVKTVELAPEQIDDTLIEKAVAEVRKP